MFEEVVDNSMGSLRNCTPCTCYCYRKQGNYVFREGTKGKISVRTSLITSHTLIPLAKRHMNRRGQGLFYNSLRGEA